MALNWSETSACFGFHWNLPVYLRTILCHKQKKSNKISIIGRCSDQADACALWHIFAVDLADLRAVSLAIPPPRCFKELKPSLLVTAVDILVMLMMMGVVLLLLYCGVCVLYYYMQEGLSFPANCRCVALMFGCESDTWEVSFMITAPVQRASIFIKCVISKVIVLFCIVV